MLAELWEAAGLRIGQVARELGIPPSTLRSWLEGRTAPKAARADDFWSFVRMLQQAAVRPLYTDPEWAAALRAAQEEGTGERDRQIRPFRRQDPDHRFIRVHGPALDAAVTDVQGRRDERTDMNAFVRDSSLGAPSYLCWHADAPVGKTMLLADYVRRRRPADVDILTFFVSAAHGTNTRAKFEEEMADQIGEFLGKPRGHVPHGVREWKRLFAEAAAKSTRHGRVLLLVVDGLDDDVTWSGLAAESRTPASGAKAGTKARTGQSPIRGSIAALLPAPPPSGMRVIVSLRRCVRFPDDLLSERHPLRQSKHLRTLAPVPGVPLLRQPPPDATALGGSVAGLLAVAGGGLRTADLAELTGLPVDRVDRLAQGPAGRSLVFDDPVFQTYALADPHLVRVVREDLGEAGVVRHTRELLAWSHRWRTAGWPEGTPPYPLAHQLRLLTGTAERAAYVLDMPRLRRLVCTAGPVTALAQLETFEEEIDAAAGATSDGLATLVPLSAARALLRRESREVPEGAPALLVRLGDVERARGLARSTPATSARAVHLADVAVEMAYAGRADVDAVVLEAVESLERSRADQGFPGTYRAPESYTRLLGAVRRLVMLNEPGAARPLLRAVVHDYAAGSEALIEAAGMLDLVQELDVVAVLYDRAEVLSAGGTRARTAAVDLWGALARAVPSLGPHAGDRIEAICKELDSSDGLGAVDVLAAAASALAKLPAKRHEVAAGLTREALARTAEAIEALKDPESLPEDDQAHLDRELAGTLARLAQAADNAGVMRDALDDIRRLMDSLPEHLRIGVLGDSMLERAQWVVEVAEEGRAQADREALANAKEKKNAKRRAEYKSNAEYKRDREKKKENKNGDRDKKRDALKASRMRHTKAQVEQTDQSDHPHLLLLQEADDQLGAGNLLRSRELLETALRRSPVSPLNPPVSESWTVDLSQALGVAGEFSEAEAISECLLGAPDRVRYLAALSLGCSLGGHGDAGRRYAHEAARLVSDSRDPGLANAAAQALACAGDGPAASAMAMGRTAAEKRQALTAVAAGLVRHCPEEAARIAEPLAEALIRRIDTGSPFRVLPELAALLLAYPDVRQPDPRLHEAFQLASLRVADTPPPWHAPSMTVLTLLERLGCIPEENTHVVAGMTDRWQRSLQPGQEPCAELALLSAVDSDTAALWRHAEAARTADGRAAALAAAATYLAGVPMALATDSRAGDRVVRTCLSLARASGDGRPPAEATARHIVRRLAKTDAWTYTIPMLPQLAPGALGHLSVIARDVGRHTDGLEAGGNSSQP
ncbi:hypothetical protein [Streptomyces sp. NPDC086782]|uniref:hypothetical protein n=1 Tax=Streptomyces sp. NPDC086782 TaxID=3365757 RepID=UPI003821D9AE